jgi:hypothetical protein
MCLRSLPTNKLNSRSTALGACVEVLFGLICSCDETSEGLTSAGFVEQDPGFHLLVLFVRDGIFFRAVAS